VYESLSSVVRDSSVLTSCAARVCRRHRTRTATPPKCFSRHTFFRTGIPVKTVVRTWPPYVRCVQRLRIAADERRTRCTIWYARLTRGSIREQCTTVVRNRKSTDTSAARKRGYILGEWRPIRVRTRTTRDGCTGRVCVSESRPSRRRRWRRIASKNTWRQMLTDTNRYDFGYQTCTIQLAAHSLFKIRTEINYDGER